MPVVSDFTVVTKNDFVQQSRGSASYTFDTGGRHNSRAVLDLALFGGFRADDLSQTVRLRVNGRLVGSHIVNRWQNHSTIVYDRINVVIEPSTILSGNNVLRLEPDWEGSSDYLFVGPIVCHFHQAA